ncbi:uncharacterized protein LTR77_004394 [Saxophila tyrrhenica]|uniref:Uncharacterized protein n=1 Tax=Saxophila tyrrhenica TaxID=1690608 RepID=A0AAV9PFT9_9PEZI|nr:hypothetical protein LTR77_004394 [Saxophila tyrrhenica]
MASAQVEARPQQDRPRKKPIAQWFKNLTNLKNKGNDSSDKSGNKKNGFNGSKNKRHFGNNGTLKNNPYPQSGHHLQQRGQSMESSENGAQSFSVASRRQDENDSFDSLHNDRGGLGRSNRSGAPTLATNAETVHSDAGHSKAATTTTGGGALSSVDGAGADSTFSSPRNSQHSLSTTLTTIQSTSPGTTLQVASAQQPPQQQQSHQQPQVMFSHQYPVSPAPSGNAISAIPRHVADTMPNTYNSATANNLLTDNASILTLASSSKRRRRSMDTDASVRALAPSSVWGGSRESLPLSVLSGNVDRDAPSSGGGFHYAPSRPSIGGLASAERASVYSNHGGALASERNSYYSYRPQKDLGDAKSLRSINAIDSRSLAGDAKSMNADAKSLGGDVGSLKGYDGSIRSGAIGHNRNDSIPGSIGSPLSPNQNRQLSGTGGLSRRSSDWADAERRSEHRPSLEEQEERAAEEEKTKDAPQSAQDP